MISNGLPAPFTTGKEHPSCQQDNLAPNRHPHRRAHPRHRHYRGVAPSLLGSRRLRGPQGPGVASSTLVAKRLRTGSSRRRRKLTGEVKGGEDEGIESRSMVGTYLFTLPRLGLILEVGLVGLYGVTGACQRYRRS